MVTAACYSKCFNVMKKGLKVQNSTNKYVDKEGPITTETIIAAIYRDILHGADFSITSDFFEMGGDSLSAMRIAMMVEERFGVKITLEEIFKDGSVAAISRLVQVHLQR